MSLLAPRRALTLFRSNNLLQSRHAPLQCQFEVQINLILLLLTQPTQRIEALHVRRPCYLALLCLAIIVVAAIDSRCWPTVQVCPAHIRDEELQAGYMRA